MIRAILYGLSVYIVLMLIVSGISTLFSPKPEEPHLASIGELEEEEVQTEHAETTEIEVEQTETTSYQKELPFDFSINVITEIGEKTAVYKTYPIHQAEPHNLMTVAEKVTVTSPFGFDIKITEENEEEQSLLHSYSSIGYLTNYNYIEEIEKRKTKFWHKRKFVLCFIKNRIKILKSKKFWFKNKK